MTETHLWHPITDEDKILTYTTDSGSPVILKLGCEPDLEECGLLASVWPAPTYRGRG